MVNNNMHLWLCDQCCPFKSSRETFALGAIVYGTCLYLKQKTGNNTWAGLRDGPYRSLIHEASVEAKVATDLPAGALRSAGRGDSHISAWLGL